MAFDSSIRRQFPFVGLRNGIAYLDSAATAQQPAAAIDAVRDAAARGVGGVHRGLHPLADESTEAFERARKEDRVPLAVKEDASARAGDTSRS